MSALTATAVARPRTPGRSRHLVSVPTGDRVETRLGITRRGRLALTSLAAATLVATGVGVATAGSPQAAPATVTVAAGETLGDIAARHLPELPTSAAVAELRAANGLSTPFVHAGQQLVIPAH